METEDSALLGKRFPASPAGSGQWFSMSRSTSRAVLENQSYKVSKGLGNLLAQHCNDNALHRVDHLHVDIKRHFNTALLDSLPTPGNLLVAFCHHDVAWKFIRKLCCLSGVRPNTLQVLKQPVWRAFAAPLGERKTLRPHGTQTTGSIRQVELRISKWVPYATILFMDMRQGMILDQQSLGVLSGKPGPGVRSPRITAEPAAKALQNL